MFLISALIIYLISVNTFTRNHALTLIIQDLKNIKDVRMACQKVCKQGRDDTLVKVNLQSLIPTLFSHMFASVM